MRLSAASLVQPPTEQKLSAQYEQFREQVTAAAQRFRQPYHEFNSGGDQPSCSVWKAYLVPLDEQASDGRSPVPIVVKDFDERGITFQHPQPLYDRRALIVLEGLNLGRIAVEVDLSWCRFSSRGQYTSGGRFVGRLAKTA